MNDRSGRVAFFAAGVAALMLGLAHVPAFAHGGLSLDKDVCKLQLGKYSMHFTGYQPQVDGSQEFCEDIPAVGKTVVVLDAIETELRDLPIEVKIMQDTGGKGDAGAVSVLHLAPQRYPTGTVTFELTFDKPGKFVGLVTAGEKGEYVSRFPFSVGSAKSAYGQYLLFLAVPLLGFALYKYSGRSRKVALVSTSSPKADQ